MRMLCVSDVHGNLDALQAVLATAEKRSFNKLLVAGDLVFPGVLDATRSRPLETWRRLAAANAILVQGVTDRALAANAGHCVAGGSPTTGTYWDSLPCKGPVSFQWGQEVVAFFVAHGKK